MHVKYTEQARQDLDEIAHHISQDSFPQAIDYLYKLKNKIELLSFSPYMGVECSTKGIKRACRIMIIDSYLIFYTVENNFIQIKRILHHSVNYKGKL